MFHLEKSISELQARLSSTMERLHSLLDEQEKELLSPLTDSSMEILLDLQQQWQELVPVYEQIQEQIQMFDQDYEAISKQLQRIQSLQEKQTVVEKLMKQRYDYLASVFKSVNDKRYVMNAYLHVDSPEYSAAFIDEKK